jgi:hypothetical protein
MFAVDTLFYSPFSIRVQNVEDCLWTPGADGSTVGWDLSPISLNLLFNL